MFTQDFRKDKGLTNIIGYLDSIRRLLLISLLNTSFSYWFKEGKSFYIAHFGSPLNSHIRTTEFSLWTMSRITEPSVSPPLSCDDVHTVHVSNYVSCI